MKLMKLLFALSLSVSGTAQQAPATNAAPTVDTVRKARVFVTESNSWQMQGGSLFGSGAAGGAFGAGGGSSNSGGARPQTAEIIKTINQRCPTLIVNERPDLSDYVIRLEHEGGKGLLSHKDKVVVFVRQSGDAIFSASTLSVGGAVQNACGAIATDWKTTAQLPPPLPPAIAAAPAVVAMTQPAPVATNLTVDSNAGGADVEVDGEFVGSVGSTLSLAPGKHTIVVKQKGYADWSRSMNVSGPNVHLVATLSPTALAGPQ